MRIISRDKDYYDGVVQATGHDKTLLYLRHSSVLNATLPANKPLVSEITADLGRIDSNFQTGVIGFCGKLYAYAEFRNVVDTHGVFLNEPRSTEDRCKRKYFDLEHLKKAFPEYAKELDSKDKSSWWRGSYLDKLGLIDDAKDDLFIRLGVPVFHYNDNIGKAADKLDPEYGWGKPASIELNPNLKKLEFYRLVSDYQAYQELEMYLGNILVKNKEVETVMTDKDKIASHGFDKKLSFRKRKNS